MNTIPSQIVMPFGKYRGQTLGEVPEDYLLWMLRECKLSSGLRAAVEEEFTRRHTTVRMLCDEYLPPYPPPVPNCRHCGAAEHSCHWQEDRVGRRTIRAECRRCRKFLTFVPQTPANIAEADSNASPAPILDALTRLDDLGIELHSDGAMVWFGSDWRRVPPDLFAVVRQCAYQLARHLGNTERH